MVDCVADIPQAELTAKSTTWAPAEGNVSVARLAAMCRYSMWRRSIVQVQSQGMPAVAKAKAMSAMSSNNTFSLASLHARSQPIHAPSYNFAASCLPVAMSVD
eukprot:6191806-Pleurochrysis_carterae.AAC.4